MRILLFIVFFGIISADAQIVLRGRKIVLPNGYVVTPTEIKDSTLAFVQTKGNDQTAQLGNSQLPYATIQAAVNAIHNLNKPGNVIIGIGEFVSPTTFYSNINLIGTSVPVFDWTITQTTKTSITYSTPTKLINGTILKGSLTIMDCENVGVFNLGIDVGSVFTGGNSSKEGNGLTIARTSGVSDGNTTFTPYNPIKGIVVKDVTVLLSSPNSMFHAGIFEGLHMPNIENMTVWGGVHGFAIKCTGAYFRNLTAYANAYDGIIVKSNNYAMCSDVLIDGFHIDALGAVTMAYGIVVDNKYYAGVMEAAQPLDNIVIKNGVVRGGNYSAILQSDFGQAITRLTLQSIKGDRPFGALNLATNSTITDCWNGATLIVP